MGSALDGINELRGLNILRGAASYCKDGQVSAARPPHRPPLPLTAYLFCMWVLVVVEQVEADLSFVSPPVREEVASAEGLNSSVIEQEEEDQLSYWRWTKIKAIAEVQRNTTQHRQLRQAGGL